ncbi:MAG TPA: hypothetical protein VHK68_00740 [Gemmatimonadales bacterium]|nr:hypothetical protein [Gemmatimonadales bacterium]
MTVSGTMTARACTRDATRSSEQELPSHLPAAPSVGESVPIPEERCHRCGDILARWLYNPFSPKGADTGFWYITRTRFCTCTDRKSPDLTPAERASQGYDHDALLATFPQRRFMGRTFLTYRTFAHKRVVGGREACEAYAKRITPHFPGEPKGVYLIGGDDHCPDHLLHAVLTVARLEGWPTFSFRVSDLLSETTPPSSASAEDREAQQRLRRAVRLAPVVALTDLTLVGLLPSEVRELLSLLQARMDRSKPTHVCAPADPRAFAPAHLRGQAQQLHRVLGECCQAPISLSLRPCNAARWNRAAGEEVGSDRR